MTVSVVINGQGAIKSIGFAHEANAAKLARLGFNPSQIEDVDTLKCLAAAFIHQCQQMQQRASTPPTTEHPEPKRELAVAITLQQQAVMMAVAAATAHLA